MAFDSKTELIIKIAASYSSNAMVALRSAITDGLAFGLSKDDIKDIIDLSENVKSQPHSHTTHLLDQLLRESKKTHNHVHTPDCNCNHHS